jgi:hypothetical protein
VRFVPSLLAGDRDAYVSLSVFSLIHVLIKGAIKSCLLVKKMTSQFHVYCVKTNDRRRLNAVISRSIINRTGTRILDPAPLSTQSHHRCRCYCVHYTHHSFLQWERSQ